MDLRRKRYSSSRRIVYLVLEGASFLNNDSGGDVASVFLGAELASSVEASGSGSFGTCPVASFATSADFWMSTGGGVGSGPWWNSR